VKLLVSVLGLACAVLCWVAIANGRYADAIPLGIGAATVSLAVLAAHRRNRT
jgi:hypothetical protein